jgi:predicted dehydrogenase
MSKINVAIIGVGRMGITHFSIINSNPKVKVTAVVDTSTMLLSLLHKYVPSINTYADYKELFKNEKLDAVVICTPPKLHYDICKIAADCGVNVFCEKPFTTSFFQAKELAFLFEEKKLVNQVGYVNRFNDMFKATKRLVDAGVIGKIIRFKSEMYSCTITKAEEGNTWRDSHDNGGGAVFEVASHAIDLVNFLIGKPDKIVGTSLTKIFSKNVEDAVCSTFLYKNGVSGTLNVNWSDISYRKPTNKIEIFGLNGKILADQHGLKIYCKSKLPDFNLSAGWNTIYITDVFKPVPFYVRGNEFTNQLYHFISNIEKNSLNNECNFHTAKDTLEVIESIFNDFENNSEF